MIGAESTNHIRLVPLMDAAPDTERRQQILGLAAGGKVRLYTQVPPGLMAYAERHAASEDADHDSHYAHHSITLPEKLAIDQARREGRPVYPDPLPEVAFVALKSSDARTLLTSRSVLSQVFFHGLRFPPAVAHQPLDVYVPVKFSTMICLQTDADGHPPRPWVPPTGAQTLRLTWDDVRIDDQVPSSLKTLMAMDRSPRALDDPHDLRERAPGVFVLYAAARHFYPSGMNRKIKREEVTTWLKSSEWKDYSKLFNAGTRDLAFKFINPGNDRRQGDNDNWRSVDFKEDALATARATYKNHACVGDALAMIMHAADRWHDLLTEPPPPSQHTKVEVQRTAKQMLDLTQRLSAELLLLGFSGAGERKAIVDIVIWPKRIVAFNEIRRNRGSR